MNKKNINKFFSDNKEYISLGNERITKYNYQLVKISCFVYGLILLIYTIQNIVINNSQMLLNMYYAFDALHIIFCIVVFIYNKKEVKKLKEVQTLSILFEILMSAFFIAEAVFPFKDKYAIYICIAILLTNLIFIHSIYYSIGFTITYITIFAVLSKIFKTPEAFEIDLYIAMATFLASLIGCIVITVLRQNEDKILRKYEYLSRMDEMTGLYNKNTIIEMCTKKAMKNEEFTLLIMDIDNFKTINDTYGHYKGDEVLKKISQALLKSFSKNVSIGRYGGDEFIILIDKEITCKGLNNYLKTLCDNIENIDFEVKIHYCIGASLKRSNDTFDSLFKRADDALYKAKHSGKNKVEII